jgi:hypothetical protein
MARRAACCRRPRRRCAAASARGRRVPRGVRGARARSCHQAWAEGHRAEGSRGGAGSGGSARHHLDTATPRHGDTRHAVQSSAMQCHIDLQVAAATPSSAAAAGGGRARVMLRARPAAAPAGCHRPGQRGETGPCAPRRRARRVDSVRRDDEPAALVCCDAPQAAAGQRGVGDAGEWIQE